MIKFFLKYSILVCLILIFIYSFFYVQKHKHDNFYPVFNKEIELKKGKKYHFKYAHSKYDEVIDYSPEVRCYYYPDSFNKKSKFNFQIKIKVLSNSKEIINRVYNINFQYDGWSQLGFPLTSPYKILPGDRSQYEVFLEVLSSEIDLPKYKSVFRVAINDAGQWGYIRTRMVWHTLFMWLSGLILFIYSMVTTIKYFSSLDKHMLKKFRGYDEK